jgi:hypothetical protein
MLTWRLVCFRCTPRVRHENDNTGGDATWADAASARTLMAEDQLRLVGFITAVREIAHAAR